MQLIQHTPYLVIILLNHIFCGQRTIPSSDKENVLSGLLSFVKMVQAYTDNKALSLEETHC